MCQQSKIIVPLPGKDRLGEEDQVILNAFEEGQRRGFHPGNDQGGAIDPQQPPSGIFT